MLEQEATSKVRKKENIDRQAGRQIERHRPTIPFSELRTSHHSPLKGSWEASLSSVDFCGPFIIRGIAVPSLADTRPSFHCALMR